MNLNNYISNFLLESKITLFAKPILKMCYLFSAYFEIKESYIENHIFNPYFVKICLPGLLHYPKIVEKAKSILNDKRKMVKKCLSDKLFIESVANILNVPLEENELMYMENDDDYI